MTRPEIITRFMSGARDAAAQVRPCRNRSEAFSRAVDLVCERGETRLAAPAWDAGALSELNTLCGARNIILETRNLRSTVDRWITCLTPADWGVAETGALVLDSSDEDLRLGTMLSLCHIAILPESRVVSHMDDLREDLERILARESAYLAFITGPSRTADIERVLTIGVHGPAELLILTIREDML